MAARDHQPPDRFLAWSWPLVELLALRRDECRAFAAAERRAGSAGLQAGGCLLAGTFFFSRDASGGLQLRQAQGYAAAGAAGGGPRAARKHRGGANRRCKHTTGP